MTPYGPERHFRLAFARSRYFEDYESLLLSLAGILVDQAAPWPERPAADPFMTALRAIPSQAGKGDKAVRNTFTEVVSLFSLTSSRDGWSSASPVAVDLIENQDVSRMFLDFIQTFQLPGGHTKPNTIANLLKAGIRIRPCVYVTKVLFEGNRLSGRSGFGLTAREIVWFILNDLEVTRDGRPPRETVREVLRARKMGMRLDPPRDLGSYDLPESLRSSPNDFFRYGRDCMKFLEFAGIAAIDERTGRGYLRPRSADEIEEVLSSDSWFDGYDSVRLDQSPRELNASISAQKFGYEAYAAQFASSRLRGMPAVEHVRKERASSGGEIDLVLPEEVNESALDRLVDSVMDWREAHKTGTWGEAIAVAYEANRLRGGGREDLARRVKYIPNEMGVGYDIQSYELDGQRRYVEVKTTRSFRRAAIDRFTMTPNEWQSAEALRKNYVVYRIMLSDEDGAQLSILRDPVGLYKRDVLSMVPRKGADITYARDSLEEVAVQIETVR